LTISVKFSFMSGPVSVFVFEF